MPDEKTSWVRSEPGSTLSAESIKKIVEKAFPGRSVSDVQPMSGGLSNSNYKFSFYGSANPVVLRIYNRDPLICQKEVDLHRLLSGSVPVPEIIFAQSDAVDGFGPFVFMQFVEGIPFRDLKKVGDTQAIAEASFAIGETLANIGKHSFDKPGWIDAGPVVAKQFVEGPDPIPRFLDGCLESSNLQARMNPSLNKHVHEVIWSYAPALAKLDQESHLVHCDFNSPNLMVNPVNGRWQVSGVLDWEFAISGSPLFDIGNFLRYERPSRPLREPHFSRGFVEGGGHLPDNWQRLARLIDLTSLCEILTRKRLPDEIVTEVLELIQATVEDREPVL